MDSKINQNSQNIAVLTSNMQNIDKRLDGIEEGVGTLNKKIDMFTDLLTKNYVPIITFQEYKIAQNKIFQEYMARQELKDKNKWLERIILVLVTTVISGLVAFFLREAGM